MKRVLIALAVLFLLLFGILLIFKFYPSTTGKFIVWQNSDDKFTDPANPSPHLSPLPTESPLKGTPAVTVNCQTAKDRRKTSCDTFFERYPDGCKWYYFSIFSTCKDMRIACVDAQSDVSKECGV